jgi:hypothetical protein
MGPDVRRLAKVLVELPASRTWSEGSGYLLDGTHVLTARHVLQGDGQSPVPQQGALVRLPRLDGDEHAARLAWAGGEDLDVAILVLERPVEQAIGAPPRWGRLPPPEEAPDPWPCTVVGFPYAGGEVDPRDGVTERDSLDLRGTIHPLGGLVRGRLQIAGIGQVLTNEALQGLSGGPVFAGDHLVGVVYGHQRDYAGIWATPVSRLYAGGAFLPPLPLAGTGLEVVPAATAYPSSALALAANLEDFSELLRRETAGFRGRRSVFVALKAFRAAHRSGYFEIVGDAGLGKTALAAAVTMRFKAVAFFAGRRLRRPDQCLLHLCSALTLDRGLPYSSLPARASEDNVFLTRIMGEAARAGHGPVWIVVDALDEADSPPAGENPLLLPPKLPSDVYVVVTRQRDVPHLITDAGTPTRTHRIRRDAPEQEADIETYLRGQATRKRRIASALAQANPPITVDEFVREVKQASKGNFRYVNYLLDDIADHAPGTALDLRALPQGLLGYYEQFWPNLEAPDLPAAEWAEWQGLHLPVIQRLGVAAEPVSAAWLARQVDRDPNEIAFRALPRWRRVLSSEQRHGEQTWRIVHHSFATYLADRIGPAALAAAHRAVADSYTERLAGDWAQWDEYGLRHAAMHLAEAARAGTPLERRVPAERLARLVTTPGFQAEHQRRLGDPAALRRDLELALRRAAEERDVSLPLLARVAITLFQIHREQLRPERVFALARAGRVRDAERYLGVFDLEPDSDWHWAALLAIAWLASGTNAEEARQLRDRVVAASALATGTLATLIAHLNAVLDGAPRPPAQIGSVPTPEDADLMLIRLGGSTEFSLLYLSEERLGSRENLLGSEGYLAWQDGPRLVALAVDQPALGRSYLDRYLALHAAYAYLEYRRGSLWALLDAVLGHPDQAWVGELLVALATVSMAASDTSFRERFPITIQALRSLAGSAEGAAQLEHYRASALAGAAELSFERRDAWGYHLRRLAALGEVGSRLPGRQLDASALLESAFQVPYGYAGFQAPACLALAEAVQVVDTTHARQWRIGTALDAAQQAAHNIQDATFCARTTARVNAMRQRWWGSPPGQALNLRETATQLFAGLSGPPFASLHRIGEAYDQRAPARTLQLPPGFRDAVTLADLADAYKRPLGQFLGLNLEHNWPTDLPLPLGTWVNVPDHGFAPLLAACLSAQVLADPALADDERVDTIRLLVPIAAGGATELDTVLSRLLLSARLVDEPALKELEQLAAIWAPAVQVGDRPQT